MAEMNTPDPENCPECIRFLEVLQIVLDGEASEEDCNFVEARIAKCNYCLDCYETDKALRDAIKGQLNRREVPQDLVDCIKSKISALVE